VSSGTSWRTGRACWSRRPPLAWASTNATSVGCAALWRRARAVLLMYNGAESQVTVAAIASWSRFRRKKEFLQSAAIFDAVAGAQIINWGPPGSLQAYAQMVGRAGRDVAPARCVLFWSKAGIANKRFLHSRDAGCEPLPTGCSPPSRPHAQPRREPLPLAHGDTGGGVGSHGCAPFEVGHTVRHCVLRPDALRRERHQHFGGAELAQQPYGQACYGDSSGTHGQSLTWGCTATGGLGRSQQPCVRVCVPCIAPSVQSSCE
jgi:hypothetical protein